MKQKLKLISMEDIPVESVDWLWQPYLPFGKVSIIQGDPGDGKTTFALAVAAWATRGLPMFGQEKAALPMNVIYQTAEDGLGDTIKPRLLTLGADCSRVSVIVEDTKELTLCDERLELAIHETKARIAILDPLQAYLGDNVDMYRANEVRPVLKHLAQVAESTGCAIILVGHLNKVQNGKSAYRGLGSIDFRAAARSVLIVGRSKDDPEQRIVVHDKSSLAPEGPAIMFSFSPEKGFTWDGFCEVTADELLSGKSDSVTKTKQAEQFLLDALQDGPILSEELFSRAAAQRISERTLKIAKKNIGTASYREGDRWWTKLLNSA